MGVERDLGDPPVGRGVGTPHLQGRRTRFDIEAFGQRR